jgi:hypothetical protein
MRLVSPLGSTRPPPGPTYSSSSGRRNLGRLQPRALASMPVPTTPDPDAQRRPKPRDLLPPCGHGRAAFPRTRQFAGAKVPSAPSFPSLGSRVRISSAAFASWGRIWLYGRGWGRRVARHADRCGRLRARRSRICCHPAATGSGWRRPPERSSPTAVDSPRTPRRADRSAGSLPRLRSGCRVGLRAVQGLAGRLGWRWIPEGSARGGSAEKSSGGEGLRSPMGGPWAQSEPRVRRSGSWLPGRQRSRSGCTSRKAEATPTPPGSVARAGWTPPETAASTKEQPRARGFLAS